MHDAHRGIIRSPQNNSIEAMTRRHSLKTRHFVTKPQYRFFNLLENFHKQKQSSVTWLY